MVGDLYDNGWIKNRRINTVAFSQKKGEEMERFIVIAIATGIAPPYEDCQIIPEDSSFVATHKQVFGPAGKEECEAWIAENCEITSQKKFIVAALTVSLPTKHEQCIVAREGDPIIATHSQIFGPASEDACKKWADENCGKAAEAPLTDNGDGPNIGGANVGNIENIENVEIHSHPFYEYLPHIVTGFIIVIVLVGTAFMLYKSKVDFFASGDASVARGLITFLVAVVTIAIALILTLSAVSSNAPDFKERFALGKEILTILIGVLGTIIGFYFGSADKTPPIVNVGAPTAAETQTLQVIPLNLSNDQVTSGAGTIITAGISGGKHLINIQSLSTRL